MNDNDNVIVGGVFGIGVLLIALIASAFMWGSIKRQECVAMSSTRSAGDVVAICGKP